MPNLLKTDPGTEVTVRNINEDYTEVAQARDDGTIRNSKGQAYSAGAYEIV